MTPPIARRLLTLLAAAAALIALPAMAVASAQEVIADYRDNGAIEGCYSDDDFAEALQQLDPQDAVYEVARDVILAARARCAAERGDGGGDDGGVGAGVWIGIIVAVGLVALGAGVLARRGGRGPDVGDGVREPDDGASDH